MIDQHTIAALHAAIDAGDDDVLPILADALEEAGDLLCQQIRSLHESGYAPEQPLHGLSWRWYDSQSYQATGCLIGWQSAVLDRQIWQRLPSSHRREVVLANCPVLAWVQACCYPTRSAAFLALAEALQSA